MALRLTLADDWDLPIQPPRGGDRVRGHFVGRARERALLGNELQRSSQRSIFVSGHRGVGKTSLVYRALNDLRVDLESKPEKHFLIVLINTPQLRADEPSAEHAVRARSILENLIRRLYASTHGDLKIESDDHERVESLYRKAVAATFSEQFRQADTTATAHSEHFITTVAASLKASRLATWTLGLLAAVTAELLIDWGNGPAQFVPLALALALPVTFIVKTKREASTTEETTASDEAQRLYAFDNSMSTLEFDLEDVQEQLHRSGVTTIYVLDELDKLDAHDVVGVLRYFKHLFTLSSALFVFVGGEELWKAMGEPPDDTSLYRGKDYTFFSSKYFISRPSASDLGDYIDEVADFELSDSDQELYIDFKRLLAFDAQGDFFDLTQFLRDRITSFDGVRPVIEIARLTESEALRVMLQQMLELVYRKYEVTTPSRWSENEQVLRVLYEVAQTYCRAFLGAQLSDNDGDAPECAASRDFLTILHRVGNLSVIQEETIGLRGIDVAIHTYEVASLRARPAPASLEFLSEHEVGLVQRIDEWFSRLRMFANLERRMLTRPTIGADAIRRDPLPALRVLTGLGLDQQAASADVRRLHRELTQVKPPRVVGREEIEEALPKVEALLETLEAAAPDLIAKAIGKHPRVKTLDWDEDVPIVQVPDELLSDLPEGSWLLSNGTKGRKLAIAPPAGTPTLQRHANAARSHEKVFRLLVVSDRSPDATRLPRGMRALRWRDSLDKREGALRWAADWLISP
jgi:Cdc6-like AAA superfamily ATPase